MLGSVDSILSMKYYKMLDIRIRKHPVFMVYIVVCVACNQFAWNIGIGYFGQVGSRNFCGNCNDRKDLQQKQSALAKSNVCIGNSSLRGILDACRTYFKHIV